MLDKYSKEKILYVSNADWTHSYLSAWTGTHVLPYLHVWRVPMQYICDQMWEIIPSSEKHFFQNYPK